MSIRLDPGAGGCSINSEALDSCDIIVSTTSANVSWTIRKATSSDVSHSMIYLHHLTSGAKVIEAIGDGVVRRDLTKEISNATLAVAYRHRAMTPKLAVKVEKFLVAALGKKYNYKGFAKIYYCRQHDIFCGNVRKQDAFYCSELVFAAFEQAGIPLSSTRPGGSTPDDIPTVFGYGVLEYVGHLKA